MMLRRFRKKPLEVFAFQNEGVWDSFMDWIVAVSKADPTRSLVRSAYAIPPEPASMNEDGSINIPTLEGVMRAEVGDWIIRGVHGELYPIKPHIFAMTYEPVNEEMTKDESVVEFCIIVRDAGDHLLVWWGADPRGDAPPSF